MNEHQGFETFQVIHGIDNLMVALQLRHLEITEERFLHNLDTKRWVSAVPIIMCQCLVVDCFNLLNHFSKSAIDIHILDSTVL